MLKAGKVFVIFINKTGNNIPIRQVLLAAEMFNMEVHTLQYYTVVENKWNLITIKFQPALSQELKEELILKQVDTSNKKNL